MGFKSLQLLYIQYLTIHMKKIKRHISSIVIFIVFGLVFTACNDPDDPTLSDEKQETTDNINDREDAGNSNNSEEKDDNEKGDNNQGEVVDNTGSVEIASSFAGGKGTKDDPYQISTIAQLRFFAAECNRGVSYNGKYIVLTADICDNAAVINEEGFLCTSVDKLRLWKGVGSENKITFEGNFNGQGHSISGLYNPNDCLFYKTQYGEISNLTIKDSYYVGLAYSINNGRVTSVINYATAECGICQITSDTPFVYCGNYGRCARAGISTRYPSTFVDCFNLGVISDEGIEELRAGLLSMCAGLGDICEGNIINCMNGGRIDRESGGYGLVRCLRSPKDDILVNNILGYGPVTAFGADGSAALIGIGNKYNHSISYSNIYWLETACKNWRADYTEGSFSGDLLKMDEEYIKSDELLQKLNDNAKKIGPTHCGWKRSRQGYPILDIVKDPRYSYD